jgi:hypothetical protein
MRENKVIQAAAAAVILGALATMTFSESDGFGPGINPASHRAAGTELARQALSALKPGGHIIVITRDTVTFKNPATDILLESFQRKLRQANARVSAMQTVQVDPLRPVEVPSGDFQEWIHHAADGDVIISLIGPPVLTTAEISQLGGIKPNIVAFCPGGWPDRVDFRPLFAQGLLRAAIVSGCEQHSATVHSQKFDQNFTVVTAANVDDFMASAGKPSASKSP